jgi:hypothetical protein
MDEARTVNEQLETLRQRMHGLANRQQPGGLTEPDPDTPEERWNAAQVWAHVAEFVGYWHAQLEDVVRSYDGAPVPFGRTKTDAGRITAIAIGRHRPVADLAATADQAIADLERYLATLDQQAWQARGLHIVRGVLDVPQMVDRFVINHLDEHAKQLEGLAESA